MTPEEKLDAIKAKLDALDNEDNRYSGGWKGMQSGPFRAYSARPRCPHRTLRETPS